jgi:hypothetical protein
LKTGPQNNRALNDRLRSVFSTLCGLARRKNVKNRPKKPHQIASPSEPIQAVRGLKSFYLRRYPIGFDQRHRSGDCELPVLGRGFFAKHWIKSGLLASLTMLPAALFAAPAICKLTHLLTREDKL